MLSKGSDGWYQTRANSLIFGRACQNVLSSYLKKVSKLTLAKLTSAAVRQSSLHSTDLLLIFILGSHLRNLVSEDRWIIVMLGEGGRFERKIPNASYFRATRLLAR